MKFFLNKWQQQTYFFKISLMYGQNESLAYSGWTLRKYSTISIPLWKPMFPHVLRIWASPKQDEDIKQTKW